jgi:hypothetical protein
MIALVPTEADLDRLALEDGESRDELHLTLAFLGRSVDWSPEQQSLLTRALVDVTNQLPITAEAFGANHWNVGTDAPAWVLAIGGVGGVDLSLLHTDVWKVLLDNAEDLPTIPAQHQPWVPHICITYSGDPGLAPVIEQRLGKITFEYLRIAFGDDVIDIVLGSAVRETNECLPCGDLAAGGLMPYDIRKGGGTCSASRWAVINRSSGRTMGCHGSKTDARKQQAALYVAESNGVTDEAALVVRSMELMYEMEVDVADEDAEVATDPTHEHFHLDDAFAVDTTPWNGAAAMRACSNAACYNSICAGKRAGDPSLRSSHALPHHKSPGSPPNAGGVRNALSRLPQTQGLTNKEAARRHLEAHMSSVKNAGVEDDEFFVVEAEYMDEVDEVQAAVQPDDQGNCPDGYRKLGDNCVPDSSSEASEVESFGGDPSTGTPADKRKKTTKPQQRGYEEIRQLALAVEPEPGSRWEAALTVEGRPTGDGREFDVESLSWDEMPVTLTYQPPSHGGMSGDGIVVGRIDEVWRDGEFIMGRGVFDMKDPQAAEIARKVREGFLKGVSVDVDDYMSDMEFVWPEEAEEAEAGNLEQILFGKPEKVVYHKGRIRGAAVVAIPAFVEAKIRLLADDEVTASGEAPFQQYGAIGAHDAPTSDAPWDLLAQEARLPAQLQPTVAYGMYAWLSFRGEQLETIGRQYCHLPHHEVDEEGRVGAANVTGVTTALRHLADMEIPDGRRGQVYHHLAAHLRDAGLEPPPFAEQVTAAATEAPPRPLTAWFADPKLSVPTPITVDNSGRVYGHAAQWGQCHVGFTDLCVTPPREDSHPYFMTGEVVTTDGKRVAVGQITLGTGHAAMHLSSGQAAEHYDNTGVAVADVVVGNDVHGIWVAGAVRPEVEEYRIRQLRAAGQVSGDWRRIGGQLRLVGLLAVNIPGFPVPRLQARVAAGVPLSVVAAGRLQVAPSGLDEAHLENVALEFIRRQLAARVHRTDPTPPQPPAAAAPTTPDVDQLRIELADRVKATLEEGGD